jgi:hypothetical protein
MYRPATLLEFTPPVDHAAEKGYFHLCECQGGAHPSQRLFRVEDQEIELLGYHCRGVAVLDLME